MKARYFKIEMRRDSLHDQDFEVVDEIGGTIADAKTAAQQYFWEHIDKRKGLTWLKGEGVPDLFAYQSSVTMRIRQ